MLRRELEKRDGLLGHVTSDEAKNNFIWERERERATFSMKSRLASRVWNNNGKEE